MPVETAERRKRTRSSRAQRLELRYSYTDETGSRQFGSGTVVDNSSLGVGVLAKAPLTLGQSVTLRPSSELKAALGELPVKGRVAWCHRAGLGQYRIGFEYESPMENVFDEAEAGVGGDGSEEKTHGEDLYEVLQVNPKADFETIHRVYRILAQRFHPDNHETGSAEYFRRLTVAYSTLSDPVKRAAYDVRRMTVSTQRLRLFSGDTGVLGRSAEQRKRQGILCLLYRRRMQDPQQPSLSMFDLEDLLAVPREHLEFCLWYLKERGLIQRSDNNRFTISVAGVDEAEKLEAETLPADRLLPAAP